MKRSITSSPIWENNIERSHEQLKRISKEHNQKIWSGEADPNEKHSGGGDAFWRNKTRAKNTSSYTVSQNQNIHKGWSDEPSQPGALKVGKPPEDLKR